MKYVPNYVIDNSMSSDTLIIDKYDEVNIRVNAETPIKQELSDYFSFSVPGAHFMPAYKARAWDGKIRLYNSMTTELYAGLLPYVQHFADERNYEVQINYDYSANNFSREEALKFIDSLNLKFKPWDHQIDAFVYCVRNDRGLIVSPTASGKSLILYLLVQYYKTKKSLLIVPTTSLVYQMQTDFIDYGMDPDDIHIVMSGKEKQAEKQVTISTWQSIFKLRKNYFAQYEVVFGDECHLFKAKSLTSIMTKLEQCKHRFGFTGTLDGSQTHRLVLEGLFGRIKQFIKTKELIDKGHLAKFKIKSLVLKHTDEEKKAASKMKYADEMDYIVRNPRRNKFIRNLALSLNGNTLILFQYVEKHGKVLYDQISAKTDKDRHVFFVHGGTDAEQRERIRAITEKESNAIIVASFGTFSTGINIKNLHNIIFASPSKSVIRVLQSIGRGLRKGDSKTAATLFDIADDLRWKKKINYTLKHFSERIKIYSEQEFIYKLYNINL